MGVWVGVGEGVSVVAGMRVPVGVDVGVSVGLGFLVAAGARLSVGVGVGADVESCGVGVSLSADVGVGLPVEGERIVSAVPGVGVPGVLREVGGGAGRGVGVPP